MLKRAELLHRLLQLQVGAQQFLLRIASRVDRRFVAELQASDHRHDFGGHLDQIQTGR